MLRPLNPKHHLTPCPLPHFVAERELGNHAHAYAQGFFLRERVQNQN